MDAPVGDFFAVGHGFEHDVDSLMVRNSSDGRARNCYWPMPFRKSCRVTITNEGRRRVTMLYYHVDWRKVSSLPLHTPYFHARYRQALPAPADGSNYEFLNVQGRGHYVGTVMSVVQAEAGWFGEGDDYFWVDGQKPSIEGTGTEDYFNDAWGLHVKTGSFYGVSVAEGTGLGSRMTAYRWHLADPIPFTKSLKAGDRAQRLDLQRRWGGQIRLWRANRSHLQRCLLVSGGDRDRSAPGSLRRRPIAARQRTANRSRECDRPMPGRRRKISLSPDLFWSKDVVLFEANGKDARLDVPFDVPQEGDYELYTEVAQGGDYGIYTVLLDGQPAHAAQLEHEPGADIRPQTEFDGYALETYVGLAHQVGWVNSTAVRTLTYAALARMKPRPDSTWASTTSYWPGPALTPGKRPPRRRPREFLRRAFLI